MLVVMEDKFLAKGGRSAPYIYIHSGYIDRHAPGIIM